MSKFVFEASSAMKLDVVITWDSGHEDVFGFWVDRHNNIDITKAFIYHGAGPGVDARNVDDKAFFGEVGFAGIFFFLNFDTDFADNLEVIFVVFAAFVIESCIVCARV